MYQVDIICISQLNFSEVSERSQLSFMLFTVIVIADNKVSGYMEEERQKAVKRRMLVAVEKSM